MRAHWSDVLLSLSNCQSKISNAKISDGRSMVSITNYTQVIASTELLRYNHKLSHSKNLDILEVGQGFYKDDGIQSANNKKMYPKEFRRYRKKLIVRIK
jgi:guanyl-specific ribonuclease Sa